MLWKPLLCRHVIQLGPRIEVASKFRRFPDRRSQSTISSATSSIQRYTSFRDQQFIVLRPDIESNVVHSEHRFPVLWLRDNCQCTECFHSHSTSRIHDWTRFDVDVQPKEISYNNDTATLHIEWSDAHRTAHTLNWLRERLFETSAQQDYIRNGYRPSRKPWTPDTFESIAHGSPFQYSALLANTVDLRGWLQHLAVHGVAIIHGAPSDQQQPNHLHACRHLVDRVAFIRRTHYGDEFHVRHSTGTSNVAYLAGPLQMHTDLPYYEHAPGVNLLHCVQQSHQSNGAFNLLCDGLWVAERMRRDWPAEFKSLSMTQVDWLDVGEDDSAGRFHKRFRAPVICLDADGTVRRINHSVPQRDSRFTCPAVDVDAWYRALAKFVELIYTSSVQFRTQPGDILTFDNARLVHGRTGYRDSGQNVRHVIGAYLDWDEIYSRLRVLNVTLQPMKE